MMLRSTVTVLLSTLAVALVATNTAAQCVGHMTELHRPVAVRGMSSDEPGFLVRYWAWDDLNHRRGGQDSPTLVDVGHGVLLSELDWSNADVCLDGGPVERTAVLFESLDANGWGVWALVNLGGDDQGDVDVDAAQQALGQVSSRAVAVPQPTIVSVRVAPTLVEVHLHWTLDPAGEALSDLTDDAGAPLPSVRGYAVYIINGPQATPRPWDWSFGADTEPDAANGFSTDISATLVMPRGLWQDATVCFALALTFDGNGDAQGELPDSRSVHGERLGAPTSWVALPPLGVDVPVEIVDLAARLLPERLLAVGWVGQAEPAGASYRVWMVQADGARYLLGLFPGGFGAYDVELELPGRTASTSWQVAVEMVDDQDRVIDSRLVTPSSW